jgi:uncharacterized protein with beta-barrel porin domain
MAVNHASRSVVSTKMSCDHTTGRVARILQMLGGSIHPPLLALPVSEPDTVDDRLLARLGWPTFECADRRHWPSSKERAAAEWANRSA